MQLVNKTGSILAHRTLSKILYLNWNFLTRKINGLMFFAWILFILKLSKWFNTVCVLTMGLYHKTYYSHNLRIP
jgi:hypothetical protein